MLQRFSFRQLLVIAFLLVAALLAAASLRAVFTLEALTLQSRNSTQRAVELSAQAQSLLDRSVSLERMARQSVVLDDPVLRQRFSEEARETQKSLDRLGPEGVLPAQAARWRAHMQSITQLLSGPAATALDRERELALEFRELDAVNASVAQRVRQTLQDRNQALLGKLEDSRRRMAQQVSWAIALAIFMALVFGIWFTRPLKRLEHAIVDLGENRLDEDIRIDGPADLALVGKRLNWLRLRLVELDADKARFLRHISHELKTPLASLREGVSLLEEGVGGELSGDQREIVQILRHNTGMLQKQIEDLLRFNAVAFEARQLKRSRVDLLQLIDAQVDAQQLQWRARDLHVHVEGERLEVEIDAEKIGTAIANLLSNAIRFSPSGGTISIGLRRLDGVAAIDIQDEGQGVSERDQSRVFEPFYRGERQPADPVRGSGVGLSIVHEYVSAHGGRVELLPSSSAGTGAHFRLELPYASSR